ncbi:MAG: GNAT family N-acetyltransferase [Candidatus Hodarchaeota archaeon]
MIIRTYQESDRTQTVSLIADFRVALGELRGLKRVPNLEHAREELDEYLVKNFPIFIAIDSKGILLGYLVCRVETGVVWAESLYVRPENRRKGIASALYAEVEQLAIEQKSDTVYNWVHPNNTRIIHFLRKRGYTVLNLIELRKKRLNEKITKKIKIGTFEYDY